MADEYQYAKLSGTKTIRVLDLHPGNSDDPVSITLRERKLVSDEKYDALSYEWGKSGKVDWVICAGCKIGITRNLMLALRQLRRSNKSRVLWVDAICINQADKPERNQQVSYMREVYAGANRVLVWLGLEQTRAHDVFNMLNTLAWLWIKREVKRVKRGEPYPLRRNELDPAEVPYLAMDEKELWGAVYAIFLHSYFTRVWIIQEIAMAREPPRILCGRLNISWLRFSWAASFVGFSSYHLHESPSDTGVAQIQLISKLRTSVQEGMVVPWRHLHLASLVAHASDERDKVYGLFGLINSDQSNAYSNFEFRVNYELPISTVYQDLAEMVILKNQSLQFCHVKMSGVQHLKELPSWVPDWSTVTTKLEATPFLYLHNIVSDGTKGGIAINSGVLHVDGYLITKVDYVTPTLTCENPLPDIRRLIFKLGQVDAMPADIEYGDDLNDWRAPKSLEDTMRREIDGEIVEQALKSSIITLQTEAYRGTESKYDALWRTLIANTFQQEPAPDDMRYHFDAVIDALLLRARGVCWEGVKDCDKTRMGLDSRIRLELDPEARRLWDMMAEKDASPVFREMGHTVAGRVFLTTSDASMGFGSVNTAIGDHIAILRGGLFPFVLRDKGDGFFEMVGDAYVHGLQDAFPQIMKTSKIRRFQIR